MGGILGLRRKNKREGGIWEPSVVDPLTSSRKFLKEYTVRFRKQAQGLIFFKGHFWGAYFWRGLCTEGNLRLKIDWASLLLGRKFVVFLCFTLYLREISKYKPLGGLIFGLAILKLTEGFWVTSLGNLYLEGLIHGGAYFRNCMVYLLLY